MSILCDRDFAIGGSYGFPARAQRPDEAVAAVHNALPKQALLREGQAVKVPARQGFVRIACDSGRLWITQFDDSRDLVLRPGESMNVDARRKVVIQGLTDALFRME